MIADIQHKMKDDTAAVLTYPVQMWGMRFTSFATRTAAQMSSPTIQCWLRSSCYWWIISSSQRGTVSWQYRARSSWSRGDCSSACVMWAVSWCEVIRSWCVRVHGNTIVRRNSHYKMEQRNKNAAEWTKYYLPTIVMNRATEKINRVPRILICSEFLRNHGNSA